MYTIKLYDQIINQQIDPLIQKITTGYKWFTSFP